MKNRIISVFRTAAVWVFRSWPFAVSMLILVTGWEALSWFYDDLILPSPRSVAAEMLVLARDGRLFDQLLITGRRAGLGFVFAVGVGSLFGALAGLSETVTELMKPMVSVLIGTPAVAWLVLAIIWFGATDGAPVFTVFIACFPPVFLAGLQGTLTLGGRLRKLAEAYRIPWWMRVRDLYFPHVFSYLMPAVTYALGTCWKVAVMAELLAMSDGVGAALSTSRSLLDTTAAFAWIAGMVTVLLVIERLMFEPIKRRVEHWREFS